MIRWSIKRDVDSNDLVVTGSYIIAGEIRYSKGYVPRNEIQSFGLLRAVGFYKREIRRALKS